MTRLWLLVLLFAVLGPTHAHAQGRDPESVAIFPLVAQSRPEIVKATDKALRETAAAVGLRVVARAALAERIMDYPDAAAERCVDNLFCLAKLGRQAGTTHVLVGQAEPKGVGIVVRLRLVDAARVAADRELELEIPSKPAAAGIVRGAGYDIFGPLPEPEEAIEAAPADPPQDLSLDLIPLPENAAPTEEDVAAPQPQAPPPAKGASWVTYTGIGLIGAGAIVGGLGAYFGIQARNANGELDANGPKTTPQKKAKKLGERTNKNADRANLAFIGAGAVVALGAGLLALDAVLLDDTRATVQVSDGGGSASVIIPF